MFILIDKTNLVVDAAAFKDSLDQANMQNKDLALIEIEKDQIIMVGDEYVPGTKSIMKRPGNYPRPAMEELAEKQIQGEMRRQAIASLKSKGVLPADYVDARAVPEEPVTLRDKSE